MPSFLSGIIAKVLSPLTKLTMPVGAAPFAEAAITFAVQVNSLLSGEAMIFGRRLHNDERDGEPRTLAHRVRARSRRHHR